MPRSRRPKQPSEPPRVVKGDAAFRREQLLDALTDTLYRLWLKQHGIDLIPRGV
jgi:hypothetical protein